MKKIEEHFVNQSINIITKHKYIIDELNTYEEILNNNKKVLLDLKDELEDITGSDLDSATQHAELMLLMEQYDKEMELLHNKIAPFIEQLDQVKKETNILYTAIRNKYPEYSDAELQEQLAIQINEKETY